MIFEVPTYKYYIYTYIGPMVPLRVPGPELRYKSSGVFRIQTSDVRGPFRIQDTRTSQKNGQYENCAHFCDAFFICSPMFP